MSQRLSAAERQRRNAQWVVIGAVATMLTLIGVIVTLASTPDDGDDVVAVGGDFTTTTEATTTTPSTRERRSSTTDASTTSSTAGPTTPTTAGANVTATTVRRATTQTTRRTATTRGTTATTRSTTATTRSTTSTTRQPTTTTTQPQGTSPRLESSGGDIAGGTLVFTFDQPVRLGASIAQLAVFGGDSTCAVATGAGQAVVAGSGTATVTVSASGMVAGTTYVTLGSGTFVGVTGDLPNPAVGCLAVATGATSRPVFLGAVGDGAEAAGRVATLTFDRPVEAADAAAVELFANPGCTESSGTGTGFVPAPPGSSEVAVLLDGLVPGTMYLRVGAGAVVDPTTRDPNIAVGCVAVTVADPPVLVSGSGSASAGTVTLTFDRSVVDGAASGVVVYGDDATCSSPVTFGTGFGAAPTTDSVVVQFPAGPTGTVFVSVARDVARSAATLTPNRRAPCVAVTLDP